MRDELRTFVFRTTRGRRVFRAACGGEAIRMVVMSLEIGESVLWRSEVHRGDKYFSAESGTLVANEDHSVRVSDRA